MMGKKISDLTEITEASDDTYLLTDNNSLSNKITKTNLLKDKADKQHIHSYDEITGTPDLPENIATTDYVDSVNIQSQQYTDNAIIEAKQYTDNASIADKQYTDNAISNITNVDKVDGLDIQVLTKAEYNALTTKSSTTIYIIKG